MTEEKTTVKKLFAWLIALTLLVQAVPFAAIAEESEVSGLVTATQTWISPFPAPRSGSAK